MAAGFQVLGDHGFSQIDANYANLFYSGKGTITAQGQATGGWPSQLYRGSISHNGSFTTPMVFLRPVNTVAQILAVVNNGSSLTIDIVASGPDTMEYFVFDKMAGDTGGSVGLQVFDGSGRITFNSKYKPLRIYTVGKMPDGPLLANGQAYLTLSAPSNKYAAATGFRKIHTITTYVNNTNGSTRYTDAFQISDTGLTSSAVAAQTFAGSSGAQQNTGSTYLLVKVDGL